MRVLITGGAGFIGPSTAHMLTDVHGGAAFAAWASDQPANGPGGHQKSLDGLRRRNLLS